MNELRAWWDARAEDEQPALREASSNPGFSFDMPRDLAALIEEIDASG